MKFIKNLIYSNIYIAICAVAYTFANSIVLQLPLQRLCYVLLHVFCATWFIYQYSRAQYYKKIVENKTHDAMFTWQSTYKKWHHILMKSSLIGTVVSFFFIENSTKIILSACGIICLLYATEFNLFGTKIKLREIPFLKLFLISLIWAIISVIIPAVETKTLFALFNPYILKFALLQFIFISIITLPFDIHDALHDSINGTKTIPSYFGSKAAFGMQVMLTLTYILLVCNLFSYNNTWNLFFIIFMLSILIISLFFANKLSKTKIMLIFDGSMIIYLFFILLLNYYISQ